MINKIILLLKDNQVFKIKEMEHYDQNLLFGYIDTGDKNDSQNTLFIIEKFYLENDLIEFHGLLFKGLVVREIYYKNEFIDSYFDYKDQNNSYTVSEVKFSLDIKKMLIKSQDKEEFVSELINNNVLIADDAVLRNFGIRPTYACVENGMILKYYAKKRP